LQSNQEIFDKLEQTLISSSKNKQQREEKIEIDVVDLPEQEIIEEIKKDDK
jgi:hypothetical protein